MCAWACRNDRMHACVPNTQATHGPYPPLRREEGGKRVDDGGLMHYARMRACLQPAVDAATCTHALDQPCCRVPHHVEQAPRQGGAADRGAQELQQEPLPLPPRPPQQRGELRRAGSAAESVAGRDEAEALRAEADAMRQQLGRSSLELAAAHAEAGRLRLQLGALAGHASPATAKYAHVGGGGRAPLRVR